MKFQLRYNSSDSIMVGEGGYYSIVSLNDFETITDQRFFESGF
jgi:hypothetical protein